MDTTSTHGSDTQTDADLLWNDTLTLLEQRNMHPATLAMLRSCRAVALSDEELTIVARAAFNKRKIMQQHTLIEECLREIAFQPLTLVVSLDQPGAPPAMDTGSTMSEAELAAVTAVTESTATAATSEAIRSSAQDRAPAPTPHAADTVTPEHRRAANPLFEEVPSGSSKLTFERFVAGEENMLALEAAKQVANGENKSYNPLFIHGKSGLGKTHLLRAIQNYITQNDPTRLCVYRTAGDFVDEYVSAVRDERATLPRSALTRHYQDIDVLIIDDVQNMSTAAGSIRFFFETFNYLTAHGKQVVLAADRSPSQLGMGDSSFDERDTSRMDSGVTVSIQVPDYELKLNLINTFYERMKADAAAEHIAGLDGTIGASTRKLMAERAGTNIRTIESFVQSCLLRANQRERQGLSLTDDDVMREASQKWPTGQRIVTVEQIQQAIEAFYDISHSDLVGSRRNKELMEPRHVAIWLTRELTDNTLADIGKHFGNRSHATVKHSIAWVQGQREDDRVFLERVDTLRSDITEQA